MSSSPTDETASGSAAPAAELIGVLEQARRKFLALVAEVRPELLRYCARMTGSVADGEDVVQDTLARAYYELSQLTELPPLRPWLFRIAHHRAIDQWRRETYRQTEPLDEASGVAAAAELEPDSAMARRQAVRAALTAFLALAPAQRGCVILKDVLDHTLAEIAAELGLTVPAVKAALHRGRLLLQQSVEQSAEAPRAEAISESLRHYASLFNAHDWDGVRELLAEDVRLDLVSQRKAAGRRAVANYFSNYDRTAGWHMAPALLEGCEVLAVLAAANDTVPRYFIELGWRDGRVATIRDFRYVPYIAQEGTFVLGSTPSSSGHRSTS
ncbi:MAG TPA: sigma-70 family RNA polymerase sigma factor [Caldimonas sp.]|jgi:RNA polymerase sigma-70 factor (ECF subfamily)